jgi:glutathione synthase/RimK-type ligase-like ATP-grasp enzyme
MLKNTKQVVLKPVVSQGQGIYCLKFNNKNLHKSDDIKKIPGEEIVIQEFLEYDRLSRVIVVGFNALEECIFYDEPKSNNWKCSVCLNPHIKHYKKPPYELLRLAEDIAIKFNSDVCFIDIFSTKNGLVLNEINTACNLIIHEGMSKCNISKKIADYLISKIK